MIRKTLIIFTILVLTGSVMAVGGNLDIEPTSYSLDLNAGDQITKTVELTWSGKDDTTVYVDSKVSSEKTNAVGVNVSNDPEEVVLDSGETVDIQINLSSSFGLEPDNFTIRTEASAEPVVAGEEETVQVEELEPGENVNVQTDNVEVEVDPANSTNVTVKQVENVFVDPPSDRDFVRGVQVESDQNIGGGEIAVNYDEDEIGEIDESSLRIFYFEPGEAEWEAVESNVNTQENIVTAEVPHFSTYAAYGEEEDNTAGGSTVIIDDQSTQDDQDQTENDTQQNETQASNNQQVENDWNNTDQTGGQDQQSENESQETSSENETPDQENSLTGRFTESPGAVGMGIALLIGLALFGLEYVGRIDLREMFNDLKKSSK